MQKFVQGLSILSRGTLEEKLIWTFQLYDINSDGRITKEEMSDIVTAVYNLMGHPTTEDRIDDDIIKEKVERLFNVSVKEYKNIECSRFSSAFFFCLINCNQTVHCNLSAAKKKRNLQAFPFRYQIFKRRDVGT